VNTSIALGESQYAREQASVTALRGRSFKQTRNNEVAESRANARTVCRRGVLESIAQVPEARLVLFAAAAGFGKSMAMRQYREQLDRDGCRTAWLTLDESDDQPARFRGRILAALGKMGCSVVVSEGPTDGASLAGFVADALALAPAPTALLLDGFEEIKNPALLDFLQRLLQSLPSTSRLVLSTRTPPKLALGRLRARGHLVEIDQKQLRFSHEEAYEFLAAQPGLDVDADQVEQLYAASGGWAAVLWLGVYELRHRKSAATLLRQLDRSEAIDEFLSEEVFSQQSPDIQLFMLKCSILQELEPASCDAVSGSCESSSVLDMLSRAQVFVVPCDAGKAEYQFAPMIGAFLRRQLERYHARELRHLHLNAAQHFERSGRLTRAVEHALASGDTAAAVRLLNASVEDMLCQGRTRLLMRWFQALPRTALRPHYELRVTEIWALTTLRRSEEALRRLEELCSDAQELGLSEDMKAELVVLRSCILAVIDRAAEGDWLVKEDLKKLPNRDSIVYRIMVTTLASWKVASNQFAEAIGLAQMFHYRKESLSGASNESYYAEYIEGMTALAQCQVREAIAHFRVALAHATPAFRSMVAIHLAEALYEVDELQEARDLLATYSPTVRDYGRSDELIISHVLQARLAMLDCNAHEAFLRLSELESIARHEQLPRALASSLLERSRIALAIGNTEEAQAHLGRACDPSAWSGLQGMISAANDVETVDMCRHRLQVFGFQKSEVAGSLSAEVKSAQSAHRHRRALRLNLLLARALFLGGQQRQSLRTLEAALRLARQEGMTRAVLDEGAPIVELLRAFRLAKQATPESGQDAPLVAFVDKLLGRAGVDLDLGKPKHNANSAAATLTARELQTLDALASGLSNIKIAERLFVSETTVRSHLRRISAKLGTSSRTQAVCVARNLGLL
jgi:LuxR family transcriptional regulator, maltose regulon positive regulatory protein